jgi:hypothetical protein
MPWQSGKNNIARIPANANGIRKGFAKYSPQKTKNRKKRTRIVLDNNEEEDAIIPQR